MIKLEVSLESNTIRLGGTGLNVIPENIRLTLVDYFEPGRVVTSWWKIN